MSVSIGMVKPSDWSPKGTAMWTVAGIKRAAKAKPWTAGNAVPLPRAGDKAFANAAQGKGITWEENGRKLRGQVWCASEYVHGYWLLVWGGTANFPGEMRKAQANEDGWLSLLPGRYNASGHLAHSDGSSCYGSAAINGCEGCKADNMRDLIGKRVKVTMTGNGFGNVVRWGTLESVSNGVATFDDLADSSGWSSRKSMGALGLDSTAPVTAQVSDIHAVKLDRMYCAA